MTTYKSIKYNISGADLTGLTASQIPNLDTAKITSGTFADARISESSVTAHVTATDLQPLKSDLSALALREATNEASAAFNLPNQFIDTFTDDTNLGTQTSGDRKDGYWATQIVVPAPYRYWQTYKSNVDEGSGDWHRELEVFDTSGTNEITITSGMLSSNDLNSVTLGNLVNGNLGDNSFHTDDADQGAYLRFDLGAGNEKSIDKWRYYKGPGNIPCNWNIQYSSNGSSWTNVSTLDMSTSSAEWITATWVQGTVTDNATGTLIQSANTVASAKTKVGGTMLYKDNAGTATLGTDLKIYFSCDNGSNWTEASSYNAITPVYSTGIKQVRLGETTCTSGTGVIYKAVWANQAASSKETQLHGIGINY